MSGKMRKRETKFGKQVDRVQKAAKSFKAPQKDNSVRSKKRAKLNDYTNQDHQKGNTP